ncbi:exported hypothetical protein [Agrobacterium salinitolerans str. Hayward 0363]|nr:exported hypothetical protein [Agrobacterium salinitolerans str. Hayward 0363]
MTWPSSIGSTAILQLSEIALIRAAVVANTLTMALSSSAAPAGHESNELTTTSTKGCDFIFIGNTFIKAPHKREGFRHNEPAFQHAALRY